MPELIHQPIASTLGFILSEDRSAVLMVHRTYRGTDENFGKYNGIGGKLERDEDVAAGMMREVAEETGLTVMSMLLRGTLCWADFGPEKRDWLAFIFLIDGVSGEPSADNEEGAMRWIPIAELDTLPMWEGDKLFLPMVFDDDPRLFHGFMRYAGETPAEWRYTRI